MKSEPADKTDPKPSQAVYWTFFWPLALMGLAMLLGRQFQNAALARFPDAARELAVFALASSVFMTFHAALGFVPQMTNVLARCRDDSRVCLHFLLAVATGLSLPVAVLAFTPLGPLLVSLLFGVKGAVLQDVCLYLKYLCPVILINVLRQYCTGRLVQARRTGLVTVLNLVFLGSVVAILITGFHLNWGPVPTLALARVLSALIHLGLARLFLGVTPGLPKRSDETPPLTFGRTFEFFWPVAVTAVMFALSRPIIYAFAGRVAGAVTLIATLRVAFDFALIFHNPLNQFRHLFVTFGLSDGRGIRRFVALVLAAMTLLMALIVATPAGTLIFGLLLGPDRELLPLVRQSVWVLCLIPFIVTLRNWHHGRSMIKRKTRSMAAGGIARVGVIALAAWALQQAGWLDHVWAAGVLVAGFAAETLVVVLFRPPEEAGQPDAGSPPAKEGSAPHTETW